MFNLKKCTWILVLISAILVLLLCIIPNFCYFASSGEHYLVFLFGIALDFDDGSFDQIVTFSPPVMALGVVFVLILLAIGIFLLITAFLSIKDKLPSRGILWVILGIILILMPLLLRTSNAVVELLDEGSLREFFGVHLDLFMSFTIISGALVTSSGIIELVDLTELNLR